MRRNQLNIRLDGEVLNEHHLFLTPQSARDAYLAFLQSLVDHMIESVGMGAAFQFISETFQSLGYQHRAALDEYFLFPAAIG